MKKEYFRIIEEKRPGNEEEIKQDENAQSLPDAVIQSVKNVSLLKKE